MSTSLKGYFESNTFIGGQTVTPISGSDFAATELGFQAVYVGTVGNLVVKTFDGSILTFVSASGLIPLAVNAVSSSSTAGSIIGLDPVNQKFPTTTTTTTAAPTTTTTAAPTTTTTTTTEAP
jgi:hypothetical protein